MDPAIRQELRQLVDQARRQRAGVSADDCGEAGSVSSYRTGCRCVSCRKESAADRTRRRNARLAEEQLRDREYSRRRRMEKAA